MIYENECFTISGWKVKGSNAKNSWF